MTMSCRFPCVDLRTYFLGPGVLCRQVGNRSLLASKDGQVMTSEECQNMPHTYRGLVPLSLLGWEKKGGSHHDLEPVQSK